jgi:hypothetical protein
VFRQIYKPLLLFLSKGDVQNFRYNFLNNRSINTAMANQIGSRATFLKIRHFEGKNWKFSKDVIDFALKQCFSETVEGPHYRASRAAGWPWLY